MEPLQSPRDAAVASALVLGVFPHAVGVVLAHGGRASRYLADVRRYRIALRDERCRPRLFDMCGTLSKVEIAAQLHRSFVRFGHQ